MLWTSKRMSPTVKGLTRKTLCQTILNWNCPWKWPLVNYLKRCSRLYFLEEAFKIKITFSLFISRFWSLLRESLTWPLLITIRFCSFGMEIIRSLVTKLNPDTRLSAISQLTTLLDRFRSLSSSIFLILPYLAIKRQLCTSYVLILLALGGFQPHSQKKFS